MNTPAKSRNNSIDILRLIAAFAVVCLHTFTNHGVWGGEEIVAVTRFAVPLFFLFSGYFAAGFAPRRKLTQIARVLVLAAVSNALYAAIAVSGEPGWLFMRIRLNKMLFPPAKENWLVFNESPFSGHLWFLGALLYILIIDLVFSWIFDKLIRRPAVRRAVASAIAGLLLIAGLCLYHVLTRDPQTDFQLIHYRNFLWFGLPFFLFGKVMRRSDLSRLKIPGPVYAVLILGAAILSAVEYRLYGVWELYLGAIILTFLLAHLALVHPLAGCGKALSVVARLGKDTALFVYILHPYILNLVRDAYYASHSWDVGPNLFHLIPLPVFLICVALGAALAGMGSAFRWSVGRLRAMRH